MNKREWLGKAASAALTTLVPWSESEGTETRMAAPSRTVRDAAATARSLPKRVAGIALPDTKLAQSAVELATGGYPPYLLHHALRTYVFGALVGRAHKHPVDEEPLYIACLLHDLGLVARYEGDWPFEIQGAEAARKFLEVQGVARETVAMIWDGIAMHASVIGEFKRPEIALVGAGAGADVLGPDPTEISPQQVAETLAAFPRLNFKSKFVRTCAGVVARHPRGATRSFMRDIGERYVPGFKPANFCDLLEQAPFAE